ncbi:MAG: AraC family transcriptional regulator [Clostridia bacterium]|nr:AraC family transcriptional regulator [Clostridia bacterium]
MRTNQHTLCNDDNSIIIKTFHSEVSPVKRLYNEHHHTECELSLFISGKGIYKTREREYSFKSGDMFLFGSNEAHCITEISEEINLLNIHFEPRILWEHSENLELLSLFSARSKTFSNKFDSSDEGLKNIILETEKELSEKQTGYRVQARHILLSALVYIMRKYDYTASNTLKSISSGSTDKLKEAMLYIDKNLDKKLSLKEIADVACMTQTYFSSVFKKFNGISPWNYITIKRVEMAIEMIKTTDMSKLEIAERCGFSSHSNFYKLFSRITGKTPNDYTS